MKKTMFVMVVVAVLVFAFAATAMASSGFPPNRSSAYLSTTTDRVNASGGTKAGYIKWDDAKTAIANAAVNYESADTTGAAELMLLGPHSGYAMGTMKCQVCHSAHKALVGGQKLTMASNNGCMTCHAAGSSFSSVQVSASPTDQRHGSSCTTLCHTQNPHGANVSEYGAAASALLHEWIDPQVDAAFASAASGNPEYAFYPVSDTSPDFVPGTNTSSSSWGAGDLYIEIFQPGISATNAESITAPSTPAEVAAGRAFVTGYVCANTGCHMNGAFNGLTGDSFYGEWRFIPAASSTGVKLDDASAEALFMPMGDEPGAIEDGSYSPARNRTDAIKGHTLYAYTNPDLTVQTAWAASATCKSCHDQPDARLGDAPAFPHSNKYWVEGVGTGAQVIGGTSYIPAFNTSAWFMLADYYGDTKVPTNTRSLALDAGVTQQQLTVGMDGACLKCHDTGNSTEGVGKSF